MYPAACWSNGAVSCAGTLAAALGRGRLCARSDCDAATYSGPEECRHRRCAVIELSALSHVRRSGVEKVPRLAVSLALLSTFVHPLSGQSREHDAPSTADSGF